MNNAAVVGTGLIGASIGMALRTQGLHVTGWDPNPDESSEALQRGAIDRIAMTSADAIEGADLVVLAAPPKAILDHLSGLDTPALVIDVAAVKHSVVEAGAGLPSFVGTHPMAGREHGGARHASPTLFRGATWIITTDGASSDDLAEVRALLAAFGAIPIEMTAAEHDTAVATISHLPQVLAASLVLHAAKDPRNLDLASGSFRDLTRVALSGEGMWTEILSANRSTVSTQLRSFCDRLAEIATMIEQAEEPAIEAWLAEARAHRTAMAPPVVAVRIILEDRPGELARVGEALATSHVDVRDLQLRHGRHGGGGVLTISVRPGEAEPLRDALQAQDFELA